MVVPDTGFLLTALIVVLIPGTGVIYTVSTGLLAGHRASVAAAFGCTLGIVPVLLSSARAMRWLQRSFAVAFACFAAKLATGTR